MSLRRVAAAGAAALTAACALVLVPAGAASAHPLGNFTVNRYDGLVAAPGQLRIDHVEDLAEIPATQARPDLEKLGLSEWARRRCATAAAGSTLNVDGHTVPLTVGPSRAQLRPGQAGLHTLRVECALGAPLPKGKTVTLAFHSAGATTGPSWREITARGDRMTLTGTDVPKTSVSHELTSYPKDLLSSPADTVKASLRVRPGGAALVDDHQDAPAAAVLPRGADRWTEALNNLVAQHHLTVGFAALALLIAIGLGAMHALAPGHGKTLMAASAAARGGRAKLRDVMPLAASVTVTHTLGVVALGLLVTAGSAAAPSVIAWLGLASGVLVTAAGAQLVRRAWRNRAPVHGHGHGHGHSHDHEHGHSHAHAHEHEHAHQRVHAHAGAHAGAQAGQAHDHAHTDHASAHDHAHPHDHDHAHDHAHGIPHTHGGSTHTHPVAPTLRGTILLGFAGGLVPSPSAVVVLVGAAALGQAWFGLLLVVAYGVGLALTLTAAGFAVVKLGSGVNRVLDRRPGWTRGPTAALVRRTAPLGSAFVVVALGAGLVFKGAASALG
ncbi:urease accessory protein UreH domain-containing protein [Streptomyces gibsoniae]|uniref:Sulfite exporter TauE/SafE family protein n=1 Tax=Streptomyces gibsoniae TaxID=3075529 RepID=A0ABU2TWA1_9ACTN|nr:sulfite exporter TauE/SafE family protein [Streptomyces sp. DSM 41699]MDT0465246.1 sulfite exporter TauE/SafE family protein [Streptomyces sp. DSM 41699]